MRFSTLNRLAAPTARLRSIPRLSRGVGTLPRYQAAAAVAAVETPSAPPVFESIPPVWQPAPKRDEFWRKIPIYKDVSYENFMNYEWNKKNIVDGVRQLRPFLAAVLPDQVPLGQFGERTQTRDDLIEDVFGGIRQATMSIRITPYLLSLIDWTNPRNDPIFGQFIPLKSIMLPDHPKVGLDSLEEKKDSPVKGLVHRYPDKALFLATSVCPAYCAGCTRAHQVGANTDVVEKDSLKPSRKRWDAVLDYIQSQPCLNDIVISGGDSYYLDPEHILYIGNRLISMDNIRRFRFASKGLCVSPARIIDKSDAWANALINVAQKAKGAGKAVAFHTHFNHPNEITWITEMASQRLFEAGLTVRNQSILLRGVNDDVETMATLIRRLADNNINPYYVYQCDMVPRVEHLRTPLQTILDLESQIRGSIAGFMMPQFVVDLPGGGGKRLACSHKSYNPVTGRSTYVAPAVTGRGKENKVYEYWDPLDTLSSPTPIILPVDVGKARLHMLQRQRNDAERPWHAGKRMNLS